MRVLPTFPHLLLVWEGACAFRSLGTENSPCRANTALSGALSVNRRGTWTPIRNPDQLLPKIGSFFHVSPCKLRCLISMNYLGSQSFETGGRPCQIHHAAFEANLIGIDPNYRLHISDRLPKTEDGPLLDSLKRLEGKMIHLSSRHVDLPDRDRIAVRFESFNAAA